jgi:OmcA/MtrC family decaheme c-type cytochrome
MCSFCHNPTLQADGESFNLTNMIHRFHKEARFPGNLNNCAMCHENNSQNLPLQDGLMMVANAKAPVNPAPPTTNACTSCHDERQAWQHSVANTTRLGESCSVCHGANSDFAVSKVHAQ